MSEFKNKEQGLPNQTIIINQQPEKSNGLAKGGFVLSLIAAFLSWIPVVGWILWVLGFVFSFVGVFKSPRRFAIAGLAISCIGLIILLFVASFILALFGFSGYEGLFP